MPITIEIQTERTQNMLRQLADVCSGDILDGTLRAIGELLIQTTRERITQGVTPEGNPFAPLSPVTLEIRRKKGRSGTQPLIDTEQLFKSGIGYDPIENGVVIFASRKGSHAVQLGAHGAGRGRKVTIPARPFLGISSSDLDEIDQIICNVLARVRAGGLS